MILDLMAELEKNVGRTRGRVNQHGYLVEPGNDHPLAVRGQVLAHRRVLYDALGPDDQPCHWCGWVLPWRHENGVKWCINVDHLNADREDNQRDNLVPSCWFCNANRSWSAEAPRVWEWMLGAFEAIPPWDRHGISWLARQLEDRL